MTPRRMENGSLSHPYLLFLTRTWYLSFPVLLATGLFALAPSCAVSDFFRSASKTSDIVRKEVREFGERMDRIETKAKEVGETASRVWYALGLGALGILSGGMPSARKWLARRKDKR